MRERVGHGGVGCGGIEQGVAGPEEGRRAVAWAARASGRWVPTRWRPVEWRAGRRPSCGPRPVRPAVPEVEVRPAEVLRPAAVSSAGRPGEVDPGRSPAPRLLTRRLPPPLVRDGAGSLLRRALAGLAVVSASAAAVVVLGLLARAAEPAPVSASVSAAAPVVVTVEPGETVWEVAERVAPGLSGPERSALAERIVTENGLATARLHAGQVLRVAGS
jgi:hypothetical protein